MLDEIVWEEVADEIHVRQMLEKLLLNSKASNTMTIEEVKSQLATTMPPS